MHFSKFLFLAGAGGLVPFVTAGLVPRDIGTESNALAVKRDTPLKNGTTINKSFTGATLFEGAIAFDNSSVDVAVVCTDCYITGQLTTELNIKAANVTAAAANLSTIADSFIDEVVNITETLVDDAETYLKGEVEAFFEPPFNFNLLSALFENMTRPTLDIDFGLNDSFAALPEYQVQLALSELDLYVQTHMVVSGAASYSLNLYTSETPLGLKAGDDLELGVVVTADLILSADGILDMESGFHLRMEEGLTLEVDLFGHNVSQIVCNGGRFEFLPVTVNSAAVALNAVLRIGVHAGIVLSSDGLTVDGFTIAKYSGGVETIAFADVANLTLTVGGGHEGNSTNTATHAVDSVDSVDNACDGVLIEGIFGMDIGAEAGASLQIGSVFSWGVHPQTMLPVYYTTVTQCAATATSTKSSAPTKSGSSTATPTGTATKTDKTDKTAALAARATTASPSETSASSLKTSVVSTSFVYTAVACKSVGMVNCPASLQTTAVTTATSTTTVTRPATALIWVASYPDPTATTALTSLAQFGNNVKAMELSVSGTPTSYVPPAATASGTGTGSTTTTGSPKETGVTIGGVHLTPTQEKIVIGATVGAGVPILIGIVAGIAYCCGRGRRSAGKE